jgi:two-component system, chemotaxis family, CheB/CheR fusion protein
MANNEPVIVTIGASAGGVTALQRFFEELPDIPIGAAFVVVVHLDPDHRSELPQILSSRTKMPVTQVSGEEHLEADHVYVIPPDRRVQLIDHTISTAEFEEPRGKRTPIDLFFRSAAQRVGDGFAVVLSGAGSDGSLGVRAVKEAGGIIMVQEPTEAEYSSMPRAAIASGVADFILPVRDLASRLVDLVRLKQSGALSAESEAHDEMLPRILAHLRVRTGHDFSKYKRSTVVRRLARRMQVSKADTLAAYYEVLRDNPNEAQALLSDLLISVTTFFRDREAFEALQKTLPELFGQKGMNDTIRVWVPGCATGEEAYSIAILMQEEAAKHELHPSLQIFGSDLDARALAMAREGRYPAAIEADVNEDRLRRFFIRDVDGYRVRQELRDTILFAMHDLLKDPPFSHLDLISCRNVLIYLDRDLQDQVCSTFHYSLNPGGFLLLGPSETAESPAGLFRTIDRTARIYQSIPQPGDRPRLLPRLLGPITVRDQAALIGRHVSPSVALSEATLHRRILEKMAPPSILVDDMHRVIHLSESAGRYIQPSGGSLTGDVADLARPELRFELRSALHRYFEQHQTTLSLPIMVQFNGAQHRVQIQVIGSDDETETRHAVVMFIDGGPIEESVGGGELAASADTAVVRRLQQELELTQVRLRTVREESEAANEELRAANEELQSINEEYRSTSEELETSKEELQSINEELQTVNAELKIKLETISRAHSDLSNLLAATDFGTLFLDSNLHIKRFTERVTELFSITQADEGRPIADFSHKLDYGEFIDAAKKVLSDLMPIRREVRSQNNLWYDVRMRPYRTEDNKIDGVVITFVDITERLQTEQALKDSEQKLRQQKRVLELTRVPIFSWEIGGVILDWNRGCEELYGYTRDEAIGQNKDGLLRTEVPRSSFEEVTRVLHSEGIWTGQLRHRAKDGRVLLVEAVMQFLDQVDGRQIAFESVRDISGLPGEAQSRKHRQQREPRGKSKK